MSMSMRSSVSAPLTVAELRQELTESQNSRYLDYQIEWWITHKKFKKVDVLRTINNQATNENRTMAILTDDEYRRLIIHELNRCCLNVYHVPETHHVVVYINSRNKPKHFVEQEAADSMLLFMYYTQNLLETLEYPGAQAELVVDMLGGPMPTIAELKGQISMFSGILGRTFPRIYGQLILCCNWGTFFRKAIMALGNKAGLSALVVSPKELFARYGIENVPTVIGGELDLTTIEPVGTQVDRFFTNGGNHRTFALDRIESYVVAAPVDAVPTVTEPNDETKSEDGPVCNPVSWACLMAKPLPFSSTPSVSLAGSLNTSQMMPIIPAPGNSTHHTDPSSDTICYRPTTPTPRPSGPSLLRSHSAPKTAAPTPSTTQAEYLILGSLVFTLIMALLSGHLKTIASTAGAMGVVMYNMPLFRGLNHHRHSSRHEHLRRSPRTPDGSHLPHSGSDGRLPTLTREPTSVDFSDPSSVSEKLYGHILNQAHSECLALVQPMALYIDIQDKTTADEERNELSALVFAATLPPQDKERVKHCLQSVSTATAIANCAHIGPVWNHWAEFYNWLRMIATTPTSCVCGCGLLGTMDFLENHLQFGSLAQQRVLRKIARYDSPTSPTSMNRRSSLDRRSSLNVGNGLSGSHTPASGSHSPTTVSEDGQQPYSVQPSRLLHGQQYRIRLRNEGLYMQPNSRSRKPLGTTDQTDTSTLFHIERKEENLVSFRSVFGTYCVMWLMPSLGKLVLTTWRTSGKPSVANDWVTFRLHSPDSSSDGSFLISDRDTLHAVQGSGKYLRLKLKSHCFTYTKKINKATRFLLE